MEINLHNHHDGKITQRVFLRTISILYLALLLGPIIFGIVAYMQTGKTVFDYKNTNDPFMIFVPTMAIVGFIASNLIFNQQLYYNTHEKPLKKRIIDYQTALVIRYASLEAPALFGVGAYLITGNLLFMLISALVVLYFLFVRPTRSKLINDLELTNDENTQFETSI